MADGFMINLAPPLQHRLGSPGTSDAHGREQERRYDTGVLPATDYPRRPRRTSGPPDQPFSAPAAMLAMKCREPMMKTPLNGTTLISAPAITAP